MHISYLKEAEEAESNRYVCRSRRVVRAKDRRDDMKMRWTGGGVGRRGGHLSCSFIHLFYRDAIQLML